MRRGGPTAQVVVDVRSSPRRAPTVVLRPPRCRRPARGSPLEITSTDVMARNRCPASPHGELRRVAARRPLTARLNGQQRRGGVGSIAEQPPIPDGRHVSASRSSADGHSVLVALHRRRDERDRFPPRWWRDLDAAVIAWPGAWPPGRRRRAPRSGVSADRPSRVDLDGWRWRSPARAGTDDEIVRRVGIDPAPGRSGW